MKSDQIKAQIAISEIVGKDIPLTKNGPEWQACCPFHKEHTPSFTINDARGFYHCFGCGAHGSVIDYIMESRSMDFKQACDYLGSGTEIDINQEKLPAKAPVDIYAGYLPIIPVPSSAGKIIAKKRVMIWNPKKPEKKEVSWNPVLVHEYKNQAEELLGYVIRTYFEDGRKNTPTVLWCKRPDGSEGWTLISFPIKRPLYIRGKVVPGQQVIISAEGEKSADAIYQLTGKTAVAWPQGSNNTEPNDWEILKGCDIIIWPDKDEIGLQSADKVGAILTGVGIKRVRILIPPSEIVNDVDIYCKGWDAADAINPQPDTHQPWDKAKFLEWARTSIVDYKPGEKVSNSIGLNENPQEKSPANQNSTQSKKKKGPASPVTPISNDNEEPFKILGQYEDTYYYLPRRSKRPVGLSAAQHTKSNLFKLATYEWWEFKFMGERGIKWDNIISMLIDIADKKDVFDPASSFRGRGAWREENKKIIHLGNKVYVDGQEYLPTETPTEYIYPKSRSVKIKQVPECTTADANQFAKLCQRLSWYNPLSARLLSGWCVLAPICGALPWRPHIWITGPSGSGKTTVIKKIVSSVIEPFSLKIEVTPTEAGIRQMIKSDAIPVVFDEAEGENKQTAEEMKKILMLARAASSGAEIPKGTSDGKGMLYKIYSMFCFSSINSSVKDFADQTRVTMLELTPDARLNSKDMYAQLAIDIKELLTPEFASAMIMRSIKYIDVLLENITTFEKAGLMVLSEKRYADQIAPMLAGDYLCHSTKLVTLEEATSWIKGQDWHDHTPQEAQKDNEKLLEKLLSHRVKLSDGKNWIERTIGEMIMGIKKYDDKADAYRLELHRYGMVIENDELLIANGAEPINNILRYTNWKGNWSDVLRKRIHGTRTTEPRHWPVIGKKARATSIPLSLLIGESGVVDAPESPQEVGEEIPFEN